MPRAEGGVLRVPEFPLQDDFRSPRDADPEGGRDLHAGLRVRPRRRGASEVLVRELAGEPREGDGDRRGRRGSPRVSPPPPVDNKLFYGPPIARGMRKSTASSLLAVVALALVLRLSPLTRFVYFGSDVGEYFRISRGLITTGHVVLPYPGWGSRTRTSQGCSSSSRARRS